MQRWYFLQSASAYTPAAGQVKGGAGVVVVVVEDVVLEDEVVLGVVDEVVLGVVDKVVLELVDSVEDTVDTEVDSVGEVLLDSVEELGSTTWAFICTFKGKIFFMNNVAVSKREILTKFIKKKKKNTHQRNHQK